MYIMPYAKKRSKPVRRYAKKAVVRRKRVPRPLGGFPATMKVHLRYVETLIFNGSGTTPSVNLFRANSLYDPNLTGIGHQPSNFDRLSAIYDKYTVLVSRCRVYPVLITSTIINPQHAMVACLSDNGTTVAAAYAAGSIDNVLEQPNLSHATNYWGTPNNKTPMLSVGFNAKKFYGTTALSGTPFAADVATNPAETVYFEVCGCSPDGSSDPAPTTVRIVIDYVAKFSELQRSDYS